MCIESILHKVKQRLSELLSHASRRIIAGLTGLIVINYQKTV